jgi:hypothetical protein
LQNRQRESDRVGACRHGVHRYSPKPPIGLTPISLRAPLRAGIHQTVARQITGHRTESMHARYDITAEPDLAGASERLDGYLEREASRLPSGHNLGTITSLPTGGAPLTY